MTTINENSTKRCLVIDAMPNGKFKISYMYEATDRLDTDYVVPHDMDIDGICGREFDKIRYQNLSKEPDPKGSQLELIRMDRRVLGTP